jgi:putative transcription factor
LASERAYCEVCGREIAGKPIEAEVDGVQMYLCASCFEKLRSSGRARPVRYTLRPPRAPAPARRRGRPVREIYDLVDDYAERIRAAREERGWTTAALAQRLRISESMLRKIESGKVKPSIDLARRIEKVLRIKLLEPVVDEESYYGEDEYDYVTLGDIVVVDRDED